MMSKPISFVIHKQHGAALITCLVLLIVLTLIGVTSMTSSTLQEKMAGNTLNQQLSFQAAEAALREGEQNVDGNNDSGTGSLVDAGGGDFVKTERAFSLPEGTVLPGGYLPRSIPDHASFPAWDTTALADWFAGTDLEGIADAPNFLVEYFNSMPADPNCGLDPSKIASCQYINLFRITSRGTGLNDNAISVLQSIFYRL